jgi:hypothetical protein
MIIEANQTSHDINELVSCEVYVSEIYRDIFVIKKGASNREEMYLIFSKEKIYPDIVTSKKELKELYGLKYNLISEFEATITYKRNKTS